MSRPEAGPSSATHDAEAPAKAAPLYKRWSGKQATEYRGVPSDNTPDGAGKCRDMALQGAQLVFASSSAHRDREQDLSGGSAVALGKEPANCRGGNCCPTSLMQDSTALYWVRGDGLAIRRLEK